MLRVGLRMLVLVVALLVIGLANVGTAAAHARLTSSDPSDGAVVPVGPSQVVLTFNENLAPEFVTVTVTGSGGAQRPLGPPRVAGVTVTQPLPQLDPDQYTVGYRVVSDDGHPIQGRISLTIHPGGSPTVVAPPQASASQDVAGQESSGFPAWPIIVGAIVVIAIVVVAAMRPFSRR